MGNITIEPQPAENSNKLSYNAYELPNWVLIKRCGVRLTAMNSQRREGPKQYLLKSETGANRQNKRLNQINIFDRRHC